MNTDNTLNTIIDKTLATIEANLERATGDMSIAQAMEFVDMLMDMRERNEAYMRMRDESLKACKSVCKSACSSIGKTK